MTWSLRTPPGERNRDRNGTSRLNVVLLAVAIPLCVVLIAVNEKIGVVAALLALVLMLKPSMKSLAILLVVASVFAPSVGDATSIDALSYVDESASLLLGVAIPILLKLSGARLVRLPGIWWLTATVVLGLISSVIAGVGTAVTMQGAFLLLKMPLLVFGLAQFKWNANDVRTIARGIVHLFIPSFSRCSSTSCSARSGSS